MSEKSVDFDYSRELPSSWELQLQRLRRAGFEKVRSRIFWGSHESLRGVRDFTKMSRLRLEKFLTVAQEQGFQVELICGFSLDEECFPDWTFSLDQTVLVPSGLHPDEILNFSLRRLPSLKNESIRHSFFDFIDEIFSLCSLYLEPEGTLTKFQIDLTSERLDVDALDSEEFAQAFQKRYQTIEQLNLTYGTAFRSFEACASRQGFRALVDRRAWLACFDYKLARQSRLDALFAQICQRESAMALQGRIELLTNHEATDSPNEEWNLVCDDIPLERCGRKVAPLCPGGFPLLPSMLSARLWEVAAERGKKESLFLRNMNWRLEATRKAKLLVVLCARYLPKAEHDLCLAHLENGGHLFFPLHVPHYDEFLVSHAYTASRGGEEVRSGGRSFQRWSKNGGTVWTSPSQEEFGEGVWTHIVEGYREITRQACD